MKNTAPLVPMTSLRVVGVDPGAHVGLIVVDVYNASISGSRYVAHATMHASRAESMSHAERDANLFERISAFVALHGPVLAVLEEPFDAMVKWRGHRRQARGTAARLGAYYGVAVAAIRAAAPIARLVSYPATVAKGRRGWMTGKPHETTLRHALAAGRIIGLPEEAMALDEHAEVSENADHVLMALGVLTFHLSRGPNPLDLSGAAYNPDLDRRRPRIIL